MKIAIIGAGNVGRALGASLTRAGHEVTLAAANPEHARATAAELGTKAAATNGEAVSGADLIILAVPAAALESIANELCEDIAGKVVVDVSNRPTPDPSGPGTSIAEELQVQLPKSRVIKAFNTLFATRQADPVDRGCLGRRLRRRRQCGSQADRPRAVESVGLTPVDAGALAAARTLEGMAWLNISRNLNGGTWQGAFVLRRPGDATLD